MTDGVPDLESWYDLWLAAVAIQAMCIEQGMTGSSNLHGQSRSSFQPRKAYFVLGEHGELSVFLFDRTSASTA